MRIIALNYHKVCQYSRCGVAFMSNRDTAKYCCPRHNSLAYQMRKNSNSVTTGAVEGTGASLNLDLLATGGFGPDSSAGCSYNPKLGTYGYDWSLDGLIGYKYCRSDRPEYEELLVEEDHFYNLWYGIGVYDLRDRYGNRLYAREKVEICLHGSLEFLNFELGRYELWSFLPPKKTIMCWYLYCDLGFSDTFWVELNRTKWLEEEKRKILIGNEKAKYGPIHLYGVALTDELEAAGILKYSESGDDPCYNVPLLKEVHEYQYATKGRCR